MKPLLTIPFLAVGLWAGHNLSTIETIDGFGNPAASVAPSDAARVTLTYLGTAGWEISDGNVVLLLDPYFSRVHSTLPASILVAGTPAPSHPESDKRPVLTWDDPLTTDTATVDEHIKRADFILIHHSHHDHIMDAPYIAEKTGATVIGHESAMNVMRGSGIPRDKLITVRGGEDYEFGKFSVKVIPSLHSPLGQKHYFNSGVIPPTIKPPFTISELVEGGSLSYLIRIGGHQILTFGSMNYIEREMQGLRPDVVLMGAGSSRAEIYDYAGRLMRALGFPRLVLPTHWDDYSVPFDFSQEDSIKKLQSFILEVKAASPKTQVRVPKYFEPIVLDVVK